MTIFDAREQQEICYIRCSEERVSRAMPSDVLDPVLQDIISDWRVKGKIITSDESHCVQKPLIQSIAGWESGIIGTQVKIKWIQDVGFNIWLLIFTQLLLVWTLWLTSRHIFMQYSARPKQCWLSFCCYHKLTCSQYFKIIMSKMNEDKNRCELLKINKYHFFSHSFI